MHRSQGGEHIAKLETFQDQGLIGEVLGLVKIGKEASVYCCRGGPALDVDLVAAKVYRARQYRFKNDAVYQQARDRELGLRGRPLRAMRTRAPSVAAFRAAPGSTTNTRRCSCCMKRGPTCRSPTPPNRISSSWSISATRTAHLGHS